MRIMRFLMSLVLIGFPCFHAAAPDRTGTGQIRITVDIDRVIGQMNPIWAWIGYDEPNYTYMGDGKKLLSEFAAASAVPVYVRTHNLLTSGDGTPSLKWGSTNAYTEDANGNPVYDWNIIDRIFDTYIERGMKPLVEIGFMPEALSVQPDPYRHSWTPRAPYEQVFTGWAYPPKDYEKWAELVSRVKIIVEEDEELERKLSRFVILFVCLSVWSWFLVTCRQVPICR